MRGFRVHVETSDDLTGIRFKLFDNGEEVLTDIGVVDFEYLVPTEAAYEGTHTLSLAYYREDVPANVSTPVDIFTGNFTLPVLDLTATVEVF